MFRKKPVKNDLESTIQRLESSSIKNIRSIGTIFKHEKKDDDFEKPVEPPTKPKNTTPISSDKKIRLVDEIQKTDSKRIVPFLDFNEGKIFYPILSKIGHIQDDLSYLENLVSDGILEKQIFEKLLTCPIHPETFSSTMRLYCPHCNSIDVEKLNLFEHKKCGYIAENNKFNFSNSDNICPSCKKEIKNFDKEIKVPAMWYQCNDCHEKFDNAIIKLHCRKYEHDFDPNSSQFVTTYLYKIKSDESQNEGAIQLKDLVLKSLQQYTSETSTNYTITGKSGNIHKIPIFAKINTNHICIFIKNKDDSISEPEISSIIVAAFDVNSNNTWFITNGFVSDDLKKSAKTYGIKIIDSSDSSKIESELYALIYQLSDVVRNNA